MRWRLPFLKTRRASVATVFLALGIGLMGNVVWGADAATSPGFLNNLYAFLANIVLVVLQTVANLTALSTHVIVIVSQYNHFIDVPVVQTGWAIVRDITNMFFIIGLLVIAAGTILRIENYRYNRLLARLIIMAFLVNFSRLIAGFFIQTSQVIMLTFVNAYKDAMFGNFASMFGLTDVLQFAAQNSEGIVQGAETMAVILMSLLAGLALMMVALVVTLAIAIILMIRVIALWILVILSPLAFALRILPNTERYAARWWSDFGKYVTLGPVMAFILWLSLAIIVTTTGPSSGVGETAIIGDVTKYKAEIGTSQSSPFKTELLSLEKFVSFLIGIIFMIMGLQYASAAGGAAGKFAGSAVGAATGAALGASGISAIRNRTLAPIQGWIANRQQQGRAQIQQRTGTLINAGDRLAGTLGVTPGQRERGRTAARAFDRQRITRQAQERGYQEFTNDQLQQKFQTGNSRERAAAMQILQQRGAIDLRDEQQDKAFNQAMFDRRIPPAERQRLREEIQKQNISRYDEDTLRGLMGSQASADRILAGTELNRRGALNHENPADLAFINQVRSDLSATPQRLQEFEEALGKSNPRMAIETIYNGFQNGQQDIDRLLQDAQMGKFDTKQLTSRDVARMSEQMHNVNGVSRHQARDHIANSIIDRAKTPEDLDRLIGSMDAGARDAIFSRANITTGQRDRRDRLARQGFIDEAYQGLTRTIGGNQVDMSQQATEAFVRENEARLAELAKTGRLSRSSLRSLPVMRSMMDSRRIGAAALSEMVKNNPDLRDDARDAAIQVVLQTNGQAGATADAGDAVGRQQNNRRDIAIQLGRGGRVNNPNTGQDESVLDVVIAGLPQDRGSHARQYRQRAISRFGGQLRDVDPRLEQLSPLAVRDLVSSIPAKQLNQLADENPDLARRIAEQKVELTKTNNYMGEEVEGSERERAANEVRNIREGDRGLL